jgi:hypothetical protein
VGVWVDGSSVGVGSGKSARARKKRPIKAEPMNRMARRSSAVRFIGSSLSSYRVNAGNSINANVDAFIGIGPVDEDDQVLDEVEIKADIGKV